MALVTTLRGKGAPLTISRGPRTYTIGERINPTGRTRLAEALARKDWAYVQAEAVRQVQAGADLVDVNVGVAGLDEARLLPEAVRAVSEVVEVPLCIDTSNTEGLAAALAVCPGRPLVNSVSGKAKDLAEKLPLVADHGAAMIALCVDDRGILMDAQARFEIGRRICEAAAARGIALHDIVIDPLVTSVGTDDLAAVVALDTIRLVVAELDSNVAGGASNISFGLPERTRINEAFLAIAIATGMNCPITDPTKVDLRYSLLVADLVLGRDPCAGAYLRFFRKFARARI